MKRLFLTLLIMVLLGLPAGVRADEEGTPADGQPTTGEAEEAWEEMAELPPLHYVLEPDIETWLGFNFVHVNGANKVIEYGWPHSSAAGGFKINYSPLPHRLDTELNWLNKDDYNAEFTYAYKDIIKLDYAGMGLWHNLDHFVPRPTVAERDPNWDYHAAIHDNRIKLRIKWPDRAFHVFAEFRQLEKYGTIQQRFDNFTPVTGGKVSESRDIDWVTRRYNVGINGHLGPVELEYSHMIKTFDPHGVVRLVDSMNSGGLHNWSHSVIPETETNSDTVKLHTDYTGRIVGSATFTKGEKDNNKSHARADYTRAYADLTLIPFNHVTVAFRYRYNEMDAQNPFGVREFDAVTGAVIPPRAGTPSSGSFTLATPSISTRTNKAEATIRYSPVNAFSVSGEYRFEDNRRTNQDAWFNESAPPPVPFPIPFEQQIQTFKLGVNTRPLKNVDFKGSVQYAHTSEPAYPTSPEDSFKGRFDADWSPWYTVNAGAHYRFARENNNTANMDSERDNAGASVSWTPAGSLSFSLGYDYFKNNVKRDMHLLAGGFPLQPAFPIDHPTYKDTVHMYYVSGGYSFSIPLSLDCEFHQSWSVGSYRTSVSGTFALPIGSVTTADVGQLTDQNIRETGGSITAKYDLPKGWGVSVNYGVANYEDMADKPQDGKQDGTAHSMLVMLSKKW